VKRYFFVYRGKVKGKCYVHSEEASSRWQAELRVRRAAEAQGHLKVTVMGWFSSLEEAERFAAEYEKKVGAGPS
jgi:translation initiation factor 1 (eIF-1/SUI1)